jgi:hypothetical protein
MPEKDYVHLMAQATVSRLTERRLLSKDPEVIEGLLREVGYRFTEDEIAFLKTVKAKSLPNFAKQTAGFWK